MRRSSPKEPPATRPFAQLELLNGPCNQTPFDSAQPVRVMPRQVAGRIAVLKKMVVPGFVRRRAGSDGGAEAFEAGAEGGRVAADADAEVAGHFKETARDDGGCKFFAEQFEEGFGITAVREAREDDGAGRRAEAFDVVTRIEERIEQGAICGEQRAGAFAKFFEMVEGYDGEALGGKRASGGEEIVREPHAAGEGGSSEDPAAAQAA